MSRFAATPVRPCVFAGRLPFQGLRRAGRPGKGVNKDVKEG